MRRTQKQHDGSHDARVQTQARRGTASVRFEPQSVVGFRGHGRVFLSVRNLVTVVALLLLIPLMAVAQDDEQGRDGKDKDKNSYFFRFVASPAWALPSGFVRGENKSGEPLGWSPAFRAELGWQTDGSAEWQRAYNYPALGAGVYAADYGDELGAPIAAYVFYSWPFVDPGGRWSLTSDWSLGMAWNFEPFDPIENPFNNLVGAKATVYFDTALYFRFLLTEKVALYGGAAFTHFSTGQVHEPNKGLNTLSPLISIRYNFDPEPKKVAEPLPPFDRRLDSILAFAVGSKEIAVDTQSPELVETDRRQRFFVSNVTAGLSWHVYRKGRIAGGVDLTYDGSLGTSLELSEGEVLENFGSASEKVGVGLYGGYEQALGPADILVHIGAYVWSSWGEAKSVPYQRLGLRYFVTETFFAGVNLRATNWGQADFVELNAGFRFR